MEHLRAILDELLKVDSTCLSAFKVSLRALDHVVRRVHLPVQRVVLLHLLLKEDGFTAVGGLAIHFLHRGLLSLNYALEHSYLFLLQLNLVVQGKDIDVKLRLEVVAAIAGAVKPGFEFY